MYATREKYREAWDKAYEVDPPVPLNIDIELASICDLRCPFCFVPDPNFEDMIRQRSDDGRPRSRLMPVDLAIEIINQAQMLGVPALKFNWRGESTLHPAYSEILFYAKTRIKNVGGNGPAFHDLLINSNFNFKPHALEGIMCATKAMVSLDSCNPQTHAKMRVGANFERVVGNIREVLKRGHPNVWIRRVITDLNKDESFYQNCQELFADYGKFKVSEHMVFDRNVSEKHSIDEHLQIPELERTYCGYPSQRLVITSVGLVVPCCIALYENLLIGDLRKETLLEVWNGKKLKDLREILRANDVSRMGVACKGCQSWMSFKHPNRNLVNDVEVKA